MGIAGKVGITNLVDFHLTGQIPRRLHHQMIIEHLDLDFGSANGIIPMGYRIYDQFCTHKFRIFKFGGKDSARSQISAFLDLRLDVGYRLANLLQNATFKSHILDNVHLGTEFFFCTFVTDKPDSGSREKRLGFLAKQQNCSNAELQFALFLFCKVLVLQQILSWGFRISD